VLPDVPTVAEFMPGYEASTWAGVAAPRGTPTEIIDKLNKEFLAHRGAPVLRWRLWTPSILKTGHQSVTVCGLPDHALWFWAAEQSCLHSRRVLEGNRTLHVFFS
jgi:hypothetical protein